MRKCLICHTTEIDWYGICHKCSETNRQMRQLQTDLNGYTALVTGGRIRIGYAVCLRLLRQGASVIAVTRYPYDALSRYSKEPDFHSFRERLTIYGFDLKRVDMIDELISFVKSKFPQGLDILINNAAQTIRKAPSYYIELDGNERQLRLELNADFSIIAQENPFIEHSDKMPVPFGETQLSSSDKGCETPMYNSWVAKADEISAAEMLEVQLINVTAPFLLVGQLKEHIKSSPNPNKFIINVSSVEGRFNKTEKLARHVHTNMAKASLNMMTHSLASEYAADNIFIYSVDPGWVSNQFPADYKVSREFKPYLTFEDAAARICYPVLLHQYDFKKPKDIGALYKDYNITEY